MPTAREEYDLILKQLDRTGRFYRVALHVHSPDSHDFGKTGDRQRNDKARLRTEAGQAEYLKALQDNLDLVAITDHMLCSYAVALSKLRPPRSEFTVLPGMEVNVRLPPPLDDYRFHVLAVFPPKTEIDHINRMFLGTSVLAEATRDGRTAEVTDVDLRSFVETIGKLGGLCVLAHLGTSNSLRFTFHQTAKDHLSLLDPSGTIPREKLQQVSEHFKTLLVGLDVHAVEVSKPEDRLHYAWLRHRDGVRRCVPVLLGLDAHWA